MIDVRGATVCVTGGARGIGLATATAFVIKGAEVVVGDIDVELVGSAAQRIGAKGVHLDVTDPESFAEFVAGAGEVDILVNNAGIMRTGAFVDQDPAGQRREVAINLEGVMTGMHLVLPGMIERRRGHVVNVASMAGKITTPGGSVYSATKFAVVALSRAVRAELAGTSVTITTVLPAAVRTELTDGLGMSGMPLSAPEEVAGAIVSSCRHGRGEVAVPRWAGTLGEIVEAMPELIGERAKRLAGAEGRLTRDNAERRHYQQRT